MRVYNLEFAPHGTLATYNHYGCRCEACREANRARQAAWKARKSPADATHGTWNGYTNYGCRCQPCKDAATVVSARQYARRTELRGVAPVADEAGGFAPPAGPASQDAGNRSN